MRAQPDRRMLGAVLTLGLVLAGGAWLARDGRPAAAASEARHTARAASTHPAAAAAAAAQGASAAHGPPAASELQQHFDQGVRLLQAGHHAQAAAALHRVLLLSPRLVEAHVNMGYALLGLARPAEARAFFDSATALQPGQANAYYGLALAWEAQGDLAMAMGAMRSYLHLARDERPEHLRRARAALWEWEQAREQTSEQTSEQAREAAAAPPPHAAASAQAGR